MRVMRDTDAVYRVKVTAGHPESRYTTYLGPYATLAAARMQATQELRRYPGNSGRFVTTEVERAETKFQTVPAST